MIYEYRVYEAAPGKLEALNARFRNHTLGIFERHGIKNIGYWTAGVGDYSDRLIYIVAFEDEGHRERAWAEFQRRPRVEPRACGVRGGRRTRVEGLQLPVESDRLLAASVDRARVDTVSGRSYYGRAGS